MKTLFTTVALLLAVAVQAQPVFNSSYSPQIGASFVLRYANTQEYDPLNISFGANRSWTFNFDRFDSNAVTIVDPANTPFSSDYPDANGAAYTSGSFPSYSFFQTTASGLNSLGSTIDLGSIVLKSINNAPYAAVLPYGLTYGGTYTDSTYFRSVGGTGSQNGYQKDTLHYVAYGTLRLNGITYTDVSLIQQRYYNYNTQGVYTARGEIQSWFASRYSYPLVTMEVYFDSIANLRKAAPTYLVNRPTSARPTAQRAILRVAPNPAVGFVRIEGMAPGKQTVTVISALGARQSLPVQQGQIDVSALAPGVYWVEQGGRRARLVKE